MRIVSLLASATEILFALGLGEQVLAVSHECDYPLAASDLPRATRSRVDSSQPSGTIDEQVKALSLAGDALYDIDRELLRRLAPDLIVTQAQCDVCAVRYADVLGCVQSEPALAHTEVLALNPASLADVLDDVRRIGQACDARETANRYAADLQARIDNVARATRSVPTSERPSVVVLEWLDPLMAAGNWVPEFITLAGGRPLLAEPRRHSPYVTWDEVVHADPNVLIICPCGFDLRRTLAELAVMRHRPQWAMLSAVQSGRCYAFDGNAYLNRSGPRLVDALELVAHWLAPGTCHPPGGELAEGQAWMRLCDPDRAFAGHR